MRHLSFGVAAAALLAAAPLPAQWAPQTSGTNAEFRGLSVVDARTVWASGTRGRVIHTTDGGATWRLDTLEGAGALDLRDVHAATAARVWAMSAGPAEQGQARIFSTSDGARWRTVFQTADSGVFLDALKFWDDRHGIALSDPVRGALFVLVTDDGGATWTRVPPAGTPPMLPGEGAFAASGTCLAVYGAGDAWIATGGAARARVFRSTDRGRTWRVTDTPVHAGIAAAGIFSVAFVDATHGVVVGGDYTKPRQPSDNVALSDDGGATWRLAKGPLPAGYMSAVAFVPRTGGRTLVAVGLAGTARSDDGGESWRMIDSLAYNSVAFATRDVGWAVGPRGRVAVWKP
jgi:photosystem II stability/assembly factor-like uncharacterized protein